MSKKTAHQRLQELKELEARLKKKALGEEKRKDRKVGEFVRLKIPQLEKSPEFLAWLKTDLDRKLFAVHYGETEQREPVVIDETSAQPRLSPNSESEKQAPAKNEGEFLFRQPVSNPLKPTSVENDFLVRAAAVTRKSTGKVDAEKIREKVWGKF